MKIALEHVGDGSPQDRNFEQIQMRFNELAQFVYFGPGAPALTPPGRALYVRTDGGAGTTLYVYEGAGWVGK